MSTFPLTIVYGVAYEFCPSKPPRVLITPHVDLLFVFFGLNSVEQFENIVSTGTHISDIRKYKKPNNPTTFGRISLSQTDYSGKYYSKCMGKRKYC